MTTYSLNHLTERDLAESDAVLLGDESFTARAEECSVVIRLSAWPCGSTVVADGLCLRHWAERLESQR